MIEKLRLLSDEQRLDVVVITAPDNVEYYTGVPSIGDQISLLIYSKIEDRAYLYVPLLEYHRYRDNLKRDFEVYAVSKTLKPSDVPVVDLDWKQIIEKHIGNFRVGADLSHNSPLYKTVSQALGTNALDISQAIWKQRMIKETWEIDAIKDAIKITIKGILSVFSSVKYNSTETYLTGVFEKTVREHGIERFAFEPIIAFKPNNAYPHATPSNKIIARRDLVLIDVGVKVRNRCSDITRMIAYGRPTSEERKVIEAVEEAVETSIDYIKPGVKAGEVYEAAARVLEKYGYREKFIHGLGHGIGVVVHEPPYLRAGSETVLEPGMVFTIEPGVYINGKFGVRMEEDILVTERGCKVLSSRLKRLLYTS